MNKKQEVQLFWTAMKEDFEKETANENKGLVKSSILLDTSTTFDVYIFANFDICNFTKYKREHKDWVKLLQTFLYTVSSPISDWSVSRFWKFNGDSLTFRKKINSVDEICNFVRQTQGHLIKLQEFLNHDNKSYRKIYVKAAVWIAGFSNTKDNDNYIVNNKRFCRSPFGEEFVGENIDEGFRLSSCSKAGKLVVDPKIVLITYLYSILCDIVKECHQKISRLNDIDKEEKLVEIISSELRKKKIYYDFNNNRIRSILLTIVDNVYSQENDAFKNLVKSTSDCFYLMEYVKCKGVWDDRDYPIFWYVDNIEECELIYDELIAGEHLRNHKLYKLYQGAMEGEKKDDYFEHSRAHLMLICSQIEILTSVCQLVDYLRPIPLGYSEETIFDMANLYYMLACVVIKDNKDRGILIFKRTSSRKHLKHVWDLVPIKHARTYKPNEVYSICDYLTNMVQKRLNLTDELRKCVSIVKDDFRNSIKPYAFCNIYRNGETHNGILCVSEIKIESSVEDFVQQLKKCITEDETHQYSDVRLISMNDIDKNSNYIKKDSLIIKSLTPQQVKEDSDNVAIDDSFDTYNPIKFCRDYEVGISYLDHSIEQILKERETKH